MTRRVARLIPLVLIVLLLLAPSVAYGQDDPPKGEPASGAGRVGVRATGGPDGFGYVWDDGVTFSWVEISGTGTVATTASGCDDCGESVSMGFSFDFYGVSHTQVAISSNGYLTFGTDWTDYSNDCPIITTNDPDDTIAGFWDDLNLADPACGTVYYETQGTAPNRMFIVEYQNVRFYGGSCAETITFEIILYEGSNDILVQVLSRADTPRGRGNSATIGIENPDGSDGLTYGCNTAGLVYDGLAVVFQYQSELGDFVWYDTDDDGIQDGGEPGVQGIDVDLYDDPDCEGQVVGSDTTDGAGAYGFLVGAGTYCLEFSNIPAGWRITPPDQGADDTVDSDVDPYSRQIVAINISSADDLTQDMGLVVEGSISGQVYCDWNGNSTPDAGEGVDNVTVWLYTDPDCDGDPADGTLEATQDTAGGGLYYFDELYVGPPGSTTQFCYVVVVDESDPNLGACNLPLGPTTLAFLLNADDPDATGGDFGFRQQPAPPAPPAPAPAPAPSKPSAPVTVPEPATLALLGSGLLGLASYATLRWRKR